METRRLTPKRCTFAGWQTHGAPRVWALPTPPGAARDTVRALARAALAELLGDPMGEVTLTNVRGEPPRAIERPGLHLSLSHAEGLSLLACHSAPVGVDIQALPVQADAATAALFLGPNWHLAQSIKASDAPVSIAFKTAWTQHEARLKCAGEPLVEWSEALAAQLARCACTPLHGAALRGWCAALAWHPSETMPSL
ncbi:MAG: hypothetical protein K2Q97_00910 [Burkholderiaceae bacterium]|nr:hypothetical protein [Burkholderiaceae bacterium]